MFQSATLKSYVLLLNTRMFLSKCKKAFLHAEDVKVKTKSFMSFMNSMQKSQRELTVIGSCSSSFAGLKNVNAAICGAQ